MKRFSLAAVFAFLAIGAFLRDADSQSSFTQQLAPGVYYRAADRDRKIIANAGWIVFRDYVLVIDANYPWGAKTILADVRKTTNKPIRFVFDTHYHADHSFGNSIWVDAGATILCSRECAGESKAKNPAIWAADKGEGEFSLKSVRLEHPQAGFQGSMVFDDGEHRVELTRVGPGHTLGDSVAYLPKEKILFTGDLCVNFAGNNIADPDADPDHWVRALDDLAKKDVTTLIPGHGGKGTTDTLRGQRAYLTDMISGVRAGIAKGRTGDQLAKELDLKKHSPWGQDQARNEVSIRAVYAKLHKTQTSSN